MQVGPREHGVTTTATQNQRGLAFNALPRASPEIVKMPAGKVAGLLPS